MPTTGGDLALAGSYPAFDATAVRKLREAGAIILLKTNLDELAHGTRGLSSLGGQIRNPYDLTRNPGGSSGGTAVAVNVGFATVGLGTETGFSIRSPASNNAIVGIAPSRLVLIGTAGRHGFLESGLECGAPQVSLRHDGVGHPLEQAVVTFAS